ncbi:hypothetical protein CRUP_000750 [Coryphaenoides rupestris]|nr:hypothetical protein CRUP_000750 [Coryphaenoides rupestris]
MSHASHDPATLTRPSRSRSRGEMMADVPAVVLLAQPAGALAAQGVLLLLLASNPVWGANATMPTAPATNNTTAAGDESKNEGPNIAAIVAPTVVLGLLAVALVVLVWLLCVVKKKRQTEGTYRPSAEEQSGVRSVEMPDALKLPKEERLI